MRSFTRDGLTFDVTDSGPDDGRGVIALHGFPEDRHCWEPLTEHLVAGGYRVLSPDQRGYSPDARPSGRRAYKVSELGADILALADTAGFRTFDVIGHDWGAVVAWMLAARLPHRIRSLVALSVPHPRAFTDSLLHSSQALHSWYMLAFQVPAIPELFLRSRGNKVADLFVKDGLDRASAERYAIRFAQRDAMTGPINWYRALPYSGATPLDEVEIPTLYVWGDRDRYISRYGAERTARYVRGQYRFEALSGASHWLPSSETETLAPLVLEHLRS